MKIVFLGTPEFAVASLDALNQSKHEVVGVVTMPDKPAGRGHKLSFSAVKEYALKHDLPILQPTNLKEESFIESLRNLNADVFVVVAFRMLPEVVWNMPPHGTINIHGSLLPQYRGAAPINWAIINGEKETGVTSFKLQHEIDTGDILLQDKIEIGADDNVAIVHDRLMDLGAKLIIKTIDQIENNTISPTPQSHIPKDELKFAPKIFKPDCEIDWNQPAQKIHDFVRGLSPYPAAFTTLVKEATEYNFKILSVKITDELSSKAGQIVQNKKQLLVGTNDYYLEIVESQMPGKKKMPTVNLLNGIDFTTYKIQ